MEKYITLYTGNIGLLLWETSETNNKYKEKLYIPWEDVPKLAADLLEQHRQHEARKAHGEAIQARREANTPWDSPKRYCAPSLHLSN